MSDPIKEFEQDVTRLLTAATRGAASNGATGAPRRKRGAPLGNQNARKHGFYAKHLTPEQRDALAEARNADHLAEEIATVRVKIAALLDNPETDPALIFRAMWVLARMVRIEDRVRLGISPSRIVSHGRQFFCRS